MVRVASRKINSRQVIARSIEPMAYSIAEFCAAHGISQHHYFRLAARGEGPRVMKAGARSLISHEAAAAWRREREAATAAKDFASSPTF